jgi:hypothetical protein
MDLLNEELIAVVKTDCICATIVLVLDGADVNHVRTDGLR